MRRLLVVADGSLIVEAIAIGLRESGEFTLLGQVDGSHVSVQAILDANPDVVVVDEMEQQERMLELIRTLTAAGKGFAVIVLTLGTSVAWLDEVFAAGAVSAVSKAAQPAELVTLIRETVDGHVLHLHKPLAMADQQQLAQEGLLSPRELEVLKQVAAGSTNGEIARKLWVTEQTVKFHLSNVYRKLGVGNRTEASRYAHINGLIRGDRSLGP